MSTSRSDFVKSWLFETPEGIGNFELIDSLLWTIKDKLNNGFPVIDLGNNYKKMTGPQLEYYWYEKNGEILIAVEFSKKPQALIVNALAKKTKGKPPFASDLYSTVLNNSSLSIRIMSDKQLSDEGFKMWKRMFEKGHKIVVYNNVNPGQSYTVVSSMDDFKKYYRKDDSDYRQWQYVLLETTCWETNAFFNTRRMRELAGMALND